jgi:hypothetical protein
MKILYLIIFILVAITVISCYNVNEPCVYAEDFFPLKVGDKFVYEYSLEESFSNYLNPSYEVRTIGTIDINEKTYYLIENRIYMVEDYYPRITYARNEDNSVYFFDGVKDTLVYRFNPSLNSEYPISCFVQPTGITCFPVTIKKISCGSNHFTFIIRLMPEHSDYKNYTWYVTFERGKGATKHVFQFIADDGKMIIEKLVYNLVSVSREE